MNHDFTDPYTSPKTILRDSNGVSCTDSNGVMDYYVTVQKWTTCSVEWFTQRYNNVISSAGTFCMATAGDGSTLGEKFNLLDIFNYNFLAIICIESQNNNKRMNIL